MQTIIAAFALSLLFFQSAGVGKKTEREFDEMNGLVRFVRVDVEDYQSQPGTVIRSFEIKAYDVSGRATEAIRGFGKECVSSRDVYSYDAEGSRTQTQTIFSGDSLAGGGKSDPSQPPASREIYKQVFKLNKSGERSEVYEYDGAGKLLGKTLYKCDDKGRVKEEILEIEKTKSISYHCEIKYSDSGLPGERTCEYPEFKGRQRTQYVYELDATGTWIKKTAKVSRIAPNGPVNASTLILYREFQYYSSKEDQAQPQAVGERFDATKLAPCETPKIVRKAGGVFQGNATKRVEPKYPREAKAARIFGSVVVEVTVNEAGKVISARALSGPAELRAAAEKAARAWEFSPTMLSGWPVMVIGTITFNFNL